MSMIEKVARAMCEADNGAGYDARWEFYIPMAKVAIQAMREPTDGMVKSANDVEEDALCATYPDSDALFAIGGERKVWQAMIDAALEE